MSFLKFSIVLAAAAWHDQAPEPPVLPTVEVPPVQQRGLASWYGDGAMHGRFTASGEEIDPGLHTCAHRTLPLHTTVLLVNQRDPARRTWCRVNDRGPFGAKLGDGTYVVKKQRSEPGKWRGIMDISVAAAKELGTHNNGLQPIEVRFWERGAGPAVATRREE